VTEIQPPTPETPPAQSPPVATGGLAGPPARRRRRLVLAVAVVVVVGAGIGLWYALPREPKDDLGRLQGDWQVVVPGRDAEAGPPLVIRVGSDRWTYVAGGREQRAYRVALNPAASPKEIDLVQLGSDGEPATYTRW